MARKWLRASAAARKRISFPGGGDADDVGLGLAARHGPAPAGKGRFVVYSGDGQRFEVPLAYLNSDVFGELLRMSEEAFGLPGDRPITLPCDAAFMGRVISCLRKRSSRDAERTLLASMAAHPCSAASFPPCSLVPRSHRLLAVAVDVPTRLLIRA